MPLLRPDFDDPSDAWTRPPSPDVRDESESDPIRRTSDLVHPNGSISSEEAEAGDSPSFDSPSFDSPAWVWSLFARRSTPYALAVATGILLFASFYPLDFGPLGWVALVPLLLLATAGSVARPYRAAFVGGLLWTVPQFQWMRLASPPMYVAWLALAAYVAAYLPAFVGLVRLGTRRLGLPLPMVAGIAWTGLELIRAHAFTGFAWYFLGHTQHRFTPLVQIADLAGGYAISLLMASFAGLVVMLLLAPPRRSAILAVGVWLVLFVSAVVYGRVRMGQSDFPTGPRIALVQGNFESSLKHEPEKYIEIWQTHRDLTGLAVTTQPDLIVWPETMVRFPLFRADPALPASQRVAKAPLVDPSAWESTTTDDALRDLAAMSGAPLLLGGEVLQVDSNGMRAINAAYPVDPKTGVGEAIYGKLHRVPFGEYLPLGEYLPKGWLESLPVPNLAAGTQAEVFDLAGVRVLPLICFEDSVPHLVRRSVQQAGPVDVLANLTNDGWFHGSSELDQHLVSSQFRAIETRTPLVRAANTGISALIDGNGRVLQPETILSLDGQPRTLIENGDYAREFNGVIVGNVPLDPRGSVYLLLGDWLAGTCVLAIFAGLVVCWRQRSAKTATAA